jgi:CheY-like chemotaxis protein
MTTEKKILVAEDNVVLGDVVRFNLERAGFNVSLVRSGDEALRRLTEEPFDILVTDYEMPVINGSELCRMIREELKLASLHIVMCSAKGLELDREELKTRFNLEAILFKPFSIRELTSLIDKLNSSSAIPVVPSIPTPNLNPTR